MYGLISGVSIVSDNVFIAMPIPSSFNSLVISLEISYWMLPTLFLLFRITLPIQNLLWFHMNFRVIFFPDLKRKSWGFWLGSHWICNFLWRIGTFWLYLFLQSMNMEGFPLFAVLFISLMFCNFHSGNLSLYFLKFIPRYFNFWVVIEWD